MPKKEMPEKNPTRQKLDPAELKSTRSSTGLEDATAANRFDRRGNGNDGTTGARRGYHQTDAGVELTEANPGMIRESTIDGDKLPRRGWA